MIVITLFLLMFVASLFGKAPKGVLMCGIFGFSGVGKVDMRLLYKLALANESRGNQSTGIGIYDERFKDNTYYFKQAVSATDFLVNGDLDRVEGAPIIIGHTRYATGGAVNAENAHPFQEGNILGIHNGWLLNQSKFEEKYNLEKSAVDSNALYKALAATDNDYKNVLPGISGAMALAYIIDEDLYLYRRGSKPVFLVSTEEGVYFSSLEYPFLSHLSEDYKPFMIPEDRMVVFRHGKIISSEYVKPEPVSSTIQLDEGPTSWKTSNYGYLTKLGYTYKAPTTSYSHHLPKASTANTKSRTIVADDKIEVETSYYARLVVNLKDTTNNPVESGYLQIEGLPDVKFMPQKGGLFVISAKNSLSKPFKLVYKNEKLNKTFVSQEIPKMEMRVREVTLRVPFLETKKTEEDNEGAEDFGGLPFPDNQPERLLGDGETTKGSLSARDVVGDTVWGFDSEYLKVSEQNESYHDLVLSEVGFPIINLKDASIEHTIIHVMLANVFVNKFYLGTMTEHYISSSLTEIVEVIDCLEIADTRAEITDAIDAGRVALSGFCLNLNYVHQLYSDILDDYFCLQKSDMDKMPEMKELRILGDIKHATLKKGFAIRKCNDLIHYLSLYRNIIETAMSAIECEEITDVG